MQSFAPKMLRLPIYQFMMTLTVVNHLTNSSPPTSHKKYNKCVGKTHVDQFSKFLFVIMIFRLSSVSHFNENFILAFFRSVLWFLIRSSLLFTFCTFGDCFLIKLPLAWVLHMILRGLQIGIRSLDIAESTLNNIV